MSLARVLLLSASLAVGGARALPFPEEARRSDWDRGCPDWPLEIPGASAGVVRNPSIAIEKSNGVFRVFVKVIVPAERGESFESLRDSLKRLVMDGAPYPQWVLPGVNERPGGGRYFVTVDGLVVGERERNRHFTLTGPYTFQVLWFKRVGITTIELRKDESVLPPGCELFRNPVPVMAAPGAATRPPVDRVVYRMTPRADLIQLLIGEVYFLPDPAHSRMELRMRLVAKPSSMVYSLMPESLMRTEMETRARRIFDNLMELRRSAGASKAATSVSGTPSKTENRPKRAR